LKIANKNNKTRHKDLNLVCNNLNKVTWLENC